MAGKGLKEGEVVLSSEGGIAVKGTKGRVAAWR